MSEPAPELSILFADIASSVRLYDDLGNDTARAIVAAVLEFLGEQTTGRNGTVIKTIGDEVLCTFPGASDAVQAAIDMQSRLPEELPTRAPEAPPELAIRIGLHHGAALVEEGDVFGDAVNVASRMASLAKAGQIITTSETARGLPPTLRACVRLIDRLRVKGKSEDVDIYEVVWQPENVTLVGMAPIRARTKNVRLRLKTASSALDLDENRQSAVLGRDDRVDIVVDAPLASRQHARIDLRRDKFVLVDQSTNGTYVRTATGVVYLRREDFALWGRGEISLGQPFAEATDVVSFEVE